jgi:ribosomal protein S27AE
MNSNYSSQLKDTKWFKFRLKILKRDGNICTKCGSDTNLEVHHLYYISGHSAWEYPHSALITLCGKCHSKWHKRYEAVVRLNKSKLGYQPPKKVRYKGLKILNGYKVPNKDLKLIDSILGKLTAKERKAYLSILKLKYEEVRLG